MNKKLNRIRAPKKDNKQLILTSFRKKWGFYFVLINIFNYENWSS